MPPRRRQAHHLWQKYLGRADDIIAALADPQSDTNPPARPREAVITDFGAAVALYDRAQQLKLSDLIDRHVPKAGSGPSVGTYLLLAAINRSVAPCSKVQMARWFEGTALRRLLDVRPQQLTSQRFWDHMARVSPQAIEGIERDLTDHLVRHFDLDVRRVLFDATNFFTFIDTFNHRCTLAQRGKSKEGRAALRIVGLALLVTADFHIPLCHHTYPGNQPDAPTFAGLTAAADRSSSPDRRAGRIGHPDLGQGELLQRQPPGAGGQPLPLHQFLGPQLPS